MARSMIAGMTDYSHQSIDDIIHDLLEEAAGTEKYLALLTKYREDLVESKYWDKSDSNFRGEISYAIRFYQTTITELNSISEDIKTEVKINHIKRLRGIGEVANKINRTIGKTWKSKYNRFEYELDDWRKLEAMYQIGRDMAANLLDIDNMAHRLEDYVGMTKAAKAKENLSILFMSSSPNDNSYLRVDKELREIKKQLDSSAYREVILLNSIHAAQIETITAEMQKLNPDIVHFSGHGGASGLDVEGDDGNSVTIPIEGLSRLFKLFKDDLKCIIFNACYSSEHAMNISKFGIPVIGMNDEIDDEVAIKFSVGFYQAIGNGKSVEFSYEMGMVLISPSVDQSNIPEIWIDGKKI